MGDGSQSTPLTHLCNASCASVHLAKTALTQHLHETDGPLTSVPRHVPRYTLPKLPWPSISMRQMSMASFPPADVLVEDLVKEIWARIFSMRSAGGVGHTPVWTWSHTSVGSVTHQCGKWLVTSQVWVGNVKQRRGEKEK